MHPDLSTPLSALCKSSVYPISLGITGLKLEQRKTGYTDIIRMDSTYNFFFYYFILKRPFFHVGIQVPLDEQALFTVKLSE